MTGRLWRGTGLVALWLLFWGQISVANVASGVVVAAGLLTVFPAGPAPGGRPPLRPLAVARFAGAVVRQLASSTVGVARLVLQPRPTWRSGVIACPLRARSHALVTVLAGIVSLTPGTMAVDVAMDPCTLWLHVLDLRDADAERARLARLEALVLAAFGPDDAADAVWGPGDDGPGASAAGGAP